jgi:hypothetical protein
MNLPSTEDIKKAVELLSYIPFKECDSAEDKAIALLLSLAQAYLSAPVVEDLLPETRIATPLCEISFNKGRIVGFNSALRLCRLEWMKKTSVEELKEIILDTFVKEKLWNATQDLISTILAQAVSDMLNGGGE